MCGNCPLWLALGAAPETEAEAVGVTRGGGVSAAGGWRGRRKFSTSVGPGMVREGKNLRNRRRERGDDINLDRIAWEKSRECLYS